jgi:hypothetical protein
LVWSWCASSLIFEVVPHFGESSGMFPRVE